jgi:hypothetical protein
MGTSVSINETASSGPVPEIPAKLAGCERLTDGEFAQFLMYIWAMLTHHWQGYYQFKNGMIDESVFGAYVARLQVILSTPLSRAMWRTRVKSSLPVDFQEFVNRQIEGDS